MSECILWAGACDKQGYGQVRRDGRTRLAHRWAYEQARGPIPVGMVLDHLCRIPSCVNVEHLEVVTRRENQRRGLRGVLGVACKNGHPYTDESVRLEPTAYGGRTRVCRPCQAASQRRHVAREAVLR